MAIKEIKTNKYIVVIPENSKFTSEGVYVYIEVYDSKEHREQYKCWQQQVENLKNNYSIYYNDVRERYLSFLLENGYSEDPDIENLPLRLQSLLAEFNAITETFNSYLMGINSSEIDLDKLNSLGMCEILKNPPNPPMKQIVVTGKFTNQTFSKRCLYQEIKKLYPLGTVEDI